MGAEVLVLEVEVVLPRALGGHRELQAAFARLLGHAGAELLIHEHAGCARIGARADRAQHALEDKVLGIGDDRGLLRVRFALDAEELLLEGAPVIEGQDVELLVVADGHALSSSEGRWRGSGGP